MLKTGTEYRQSRYLCLSSKPRMGVRTISAKYDKTSVLSHVTIDFTDITQFFPTRLGTFLTILVGLLSYAYAQNYVKDLQGKKKL